MAESTLKARTDEMGRVVTNIKLESVNDRWLHERGDIEADEIRNIEVDDALVDTGTTNLGLSKTILDRLGLQAFGSRPLRSATGIEVVPVYGPIRVTIAGRDCLSDAVEVADSCPVLVGQVPLELLGFVVDMPNRRLIVDSARGSDQMYEV